MKRNSKKGIINRLQKKLSNCDNALVEIIAAICQIKKFLKHLVNEK